MDLSAADKIETNRCFDILTPKQPPLTDGELIELSIFLKTILSIENGTRLPRYAAERRMDAVLNNQIPPKTNIERLFKRWHRAGRPLDGIRFCDQDVTKGDWDNFNVPKARVYSQNPRIRQLEDIA